MFRRARFDARLHVGDGPLSMSWYLEFSIVASSRQLSWWSHPLFAGCRAVTEQVLAFCLSSMGCFDACLLRTSDGDPRMMIPEALSGLRATSLFPYSALPLFCLVAALRPAVQERD